MSQLTPLSTHNPPGHTPVLMVNSAATHESLTTAADHRLSAASDLLETMALAANDSSGLSGCDLHNVAWAAHLLTSDALDLLRTSANAHYRELSEAKGQRHEDQCILSCDGVKAPLTQKKAFSNT